MITRTASTDTNGQNLTKTARFEGLVALFGHYHAESTAKYLSVEKHSFPEDFRYSYVGPVET